MVSARVSGAWRRVRYLIRRGRRGGHAAHRHVPRVRVPQAAPAQGRPHAARFIVLREGPTALYRGSRAHFFRTAPHYALMFALLEGITGVERACIVRRNAETLARVPVFANLSATQRDVLARGVSVAKFARGDVIVREGDVDDDNEMFFVLRGTARSVRGGGDELDAFVESVKASPTRRRALRSCLQSFEKAQAETRKRGSVDETVSASPGREPRRWRRTVGRRALPALTLAPATTLASRRCWWTSRGRRPWWPRAHTSCLVVNARV